MENVFVKGSLYGLGFGDSKEISFHKEDWIIAESVSPSLIRQICNNEVRLVFLNDTNIFSHEMNVIRKIIHGNKNTRIINGASPIFSIIQEANECTVKLKENRIIIQDTVFTFSGFNYYKESSELLEYDIDNNCICFKPDYYYHKELAELVSAGFSKAGSELFKPLSFSAYADNDNRIWCTGGCFSHTLMSSFDRDYMQYFRALLQYNSVLKSLYCLSQGKQINSELKELLVDHYKFSLLFSFSVPYFTRLLEDNDGSERVETVYSVFVQNSPLNNKELLTESAIEKMNSFLSQIIDKSSDYKEIMNNVYDMDYIESFSTEDILFFVVNMMSDLRRCVINILINKNEWFASICGHRKRVEVF